MIDGVSVIDLFAGPGGLGEGFSSFTRRDGAPGFRIRLSIEKDVQAHSTLELRSFFRQFSESRVPDEYYEFLRQPQTLVKSRREQLFARFPELAEAARSEAWLAELGRVDAALVRERISAALPKSENWVLLGGPPCQAYSLIGRSRNRGNLQYRAEEDHRQYLYVEYLQVLADHRPAVFVMENVKGLLSATLQNQRIFERILDDLASPSKAIRREGRRVNSKARNQWSPSYRLYSIVHHGLFDDFELRDFVVPMEHYGIPQARHRVIVLGVREDLAGAIPGVLKLAATVPLRAVVDGLPKLRSGLSRESDNAYQWIEHLQNARRRRWFRAAAKKAGIETHERLQAAIEELSLPENDRGAEFVAGDVTVAYRPDWYLDTRLGGAFNHSTRGHIVKDLWRYLYAACYAQAKGRSPNLKHFPADLLPDHRNVPEAMNGSQFSDRFRVQLYDRPATTVTSHIAKDGHYYIHPDPMQCRSLTVREAARLQTFPDNYFFCGPRTSQYIQVGNAVPPLLASQIAEITRELLSRAGVTA